VLDSDDGTDGENKRRRSSRRALGSQESPICLDGDNTGSLPVIGLLLPDEPIRCPTCGGVVDTEELDEHIDQCSGALSRGRSE
jgi:hypothetical protein